MKKYLSFKILIPSLLVLFSGLITVTYIATNTMKTSLRNTMIESTNFSLDGLIDQSKESLNKVELLEETLADNYIKLANLLAHYLDGIAEELSVDEYKQIAKDIDVEEIHVTDELGVLQWGSIDGFYGFDFNTSEQTKPFLQILKNKNFTLSQAPQPRGVDGKLFSYTSVSRIDKPGIVQVGMNADVMQVILESVDTQKLIESYTVDDFNGTPFILDEKGFITHHKNRELIGTNVFSDFPWGKNFENIDYGSFYYTINRAEKYLVYKKFNNQYFCITVFMKPYISAASSLEKIMILTSSLFGIFLAFIIIVLLSKYAGKPLKELNKKILILAAGEGDLTQEISSATIDEVGQLATGINEFIKSLRTIVSNIKNISSETQILKNSLNKKAGESTTTFNKISSNVTDIKNEIDILDDKISQSIKIENIMEEEIQKLDNEVEQQVSAVEESTAAVNQMVTSLKNVSEITTSKYNSTLQLVEITKLGGDKVLQMSSVVDEIHQSVEDISSMVTIIDEIASQTGLLSMNAAIEAAHAGEHGKGFAIVADEIRKLSDSTTENAASISKILENVNNQVDGATITTKETNRAFDDINSEVESVSKAFSEINITTEELSSGGIQILEAMNTLQNVSTTVRDSTSEMKSGALKMGKSMKLVEEISKTVTNKVLDISNESIVISEGSEDLKSITRELSENMHLLDNEISRFKTDSNK